jgi:oligoribonuclease
MRDCQADGLSLLGYGSHVGSVMTRSENNLVWMDMEMTGLDPESCFILEVGVLVTTPELESLSEGLCLPIAQPEDVLESMDPWCMRQHRRSGLLERVRTSGVTLHEAEEGLLRFLRRFCRKRKSPLCGNSICQDRRFLIKYMPRVDDYLHYRNIDVSSIKELVRRWYPRELHYTKKRRTHRALDDIHESIAELKYYWEQFFTFPRHS